MVAAAAALSSPLALAGLRIETESASWIGRHDAESRLYRESLARFGEGDPLLVELVRGTTTAPVFDRFTVELAHRLSRLAEVASVEAEPPRFDASSWSLAMTRAALLNSDPELVERIVDRFEPEEQSRQLRRMRKLMLLADAPTRSRLAADPLALGDLLAPVLTSRFGGMRVAVDRGFFDAPGRGSRLLFVHPRGSSEDTEFCAALVAGVRDAVEATRGAVEGTRDVAVRLSGKFAVIAESAAVLRADLVRISAIATTLVLGFVAVTFRSGRAVLLCNLPILLSLAPALWLARLVFNPLNFFAVGFVAIVMGLGVDAMLHCTARFFQYLEKEGIGREQACVCALEDCGPPLLIGTATTAGAFLCLSASDYRGLADFGRLTATALTLCFLTSMLILPGLIRFLGPMSAKSAGRGQLRLLSPRIAQLGWRYPRRVLIASAALVALSLPFARSFSFDSGFEHLLPEQLASLDAARDLSREFGASFMLGSELLVRARSLDQALAEQGRLEAELQRMLVDGTIVGFESPLLVRAPAPRSEAGEEMRARAAARLRKGAESLRRALADAGFVASEALERYREHWVDALAPEGEFEQGPLAQLTSDPRYRRLVAHEADGSWLRTLVRLPEGEEGAAARRLLTELVAAWEPEDGVRVELTGTLTLYEHLNELVGSNFARISGFGVVTVAVLLFSFFRRFGVVLLALLPILATIPVALAAVVVAGIPFPPLGVGMLAIVLGIGIDDAVHLLARVSEVEGRTLERTLAEIGPVLTLTSLTSALGFGALAFAHHQVLSSVGLIACVGILACWLFSIGPLPACARLLRRRREAAVPLALALGWWIASSGPLAAAEPTADDLLDRIERNYRSSGALVCQFTQLRSVPELSGEIEVSGELTVQAPDRLRVLWRGEENLDLLSDGESVWLVDRDLDDVLRVSVAGVAREQRLSGLVPPFFFTPVAELRQRFRVRARAAAGGMSRLAFSEPTAPPEAPPSFVLEVDHGGRVRSVEVQSMDGAHSSTRLHRCRRTARQSDEQFRLADPLPAAPGSRPAPSRTPPPL